jgi:hypothetical protein
MLAGLPDSSGRQVRSYPQPASSSPWFSMRPFVAAVLTPIDIINQSTRKATVPRKNHSFYVRIQLAFSGSVLPLELLLTIVSLPIPHATR